MGYRNDQYFNLGNENLTGENLNSFTKNSSGYKVPALNPGFSYPDRVIRTNDHEGTQTTYLKRGYIRSLPIVNAGVEFESRKCQFQFNPATLTQSVQQNPSYLNFIQQDPAQYAQPMPGNVNFTFNLMFDRSMEMNNTPNDSGVSSDNAWERSSPGQVGVLRDLAAFYSVIGQGLSQDQLEYTTQALREVVTLEANSASSSSDTTNVDASSSLSNIPDFLEMNVGNSAFLLPLPVRVVFSSLYIVEGLVTNTTVTFTKFNTSMVPMQCVLNVTMEAKYIGFAKKDTFLSWSLKEAAQIQEQTRVEEQTRVDSVQQSLQDAIGAIEMVVADPSTYTQPPSNGFPGESTWYDTWDLALDNKNISYVNWLRVPGAKNGDAVSDLYDDGVLSGLRIQAAAWLYEIDTTYLGKVTQSGLKRLVDNRGTEVFKMYVTNPQPALNKNDWYSVAKGVKSEIAKTTKDSGGIKSDNIYIMYYNISITATVEGNTITGRGNVYLPYTGSNIANKPGLYNRIHIQWPNLTVTADSEDFAVGTVPPDNRASGDFSQVPGFVSSVGSNK